MGIIYILSKLIYKANDTLTNISIAALLILISNPYIIYDLGFILSFGGTLGIVLCNKTISKIIKIKNTVNKKETIKEKILKIIGVTISAQIVILPISIYKFNTISIYFLLTNLIIGIVIGPIMTISFIFLGLTILNILNFNINILQRKSILKILEISVQILIYISDISKLPKSKIYIATPSIISIICYFILISIILIIYSISNTSNKENLTTVKRFKNIHALLKFKIKYRTKQETKNKVKKILNIIIIVIIIFNLFKTNILKENLEIHFLDVGQGDSTFIKTPKGQTILIDGGGTSTYDIGKNILLPYILSRGYTKIDIVIISHFDTDHIGGILTILEKLNVKKVYIPNLNNYWKTLEKQSSKKNENFENYKKFFSIINRKKIPVQKIEKGQKIKIEKELYFDVLWPDTNNLIDEKLLNNNSAVIKLNWKNNFKMLFTGDIEKIAENKILDKTNKYILQAEILKVAHHGSKSSTTNKFLEKVNPKIAIIGVGENNIFGHPAETVIKLLKQKNIDIYRTDENGEISIKVNEKGKIKIKTINNVCKNY